MADKTSDSSSESELDMAKKATKKKVTSLAGLGLPMTKIGLTFIYKVPNRKPVQCEDLTLAVNIWCVMSDNLRKICK